MVVDAFDTINEEVKNSKTSSPITSADLGAALGDIFKSMSKGLQNNLETALGKSEQIKNWDKLPAFGKTDKLKTPVGKFLNNPIWLLSNDATVLEMVMAATATNVQYKMIDIKLQSENWYLTEDTRFNNKCERKGARWINYAGSNRCFQLYKISGRNTRKDTPEPADDKFYDKMAKYGLEGDVLTKYYQTILDCYQKKGSQGDLDTDAMVVPGGSMPTCFFSLRVMKILNGRGCDSGGVHGHGRNCHHWKPEDLER